MTHSIDTSFRLKKQARAVLDRRNRGFCAFVVLRRLDDHDVVAELDEDAHRSAAIEEPDTIGDLLRIGFHRRWR